jgi:SMC interacting uncharacterized protein involved in chromosome segregation
MTFNEEQQSDHRKEFIRESRQKAWDAACHADWIAKGLDELVRQYEKIKEEDARLEADIKESQAEVDFHTADNRKKRREMQERRDELVKIQNALAENMRQGQNALDQLYQSIESNQALATNAEGWEWKEAAAPEGSNL